jgi:hypothetical protein
MSNETCPMCGQPDSNLHSTEVIMPDTTCPTCGQPVVIHSSDEGTHCYTAPPAQLWLCRDGAGGNYCFPDRPHWEESDGGYWYAEHSQFLAFDLAPLVNYLNLLPGQAVALHTGEMRQGGETDGH